MPKRPTIENKYPTLRNPFGQQKKMKSTITLRERTNISDNISDISPSVSNEFTLKTLNSSFINNQEKLPPKYISSYNVKTTSLHEDNIDNDSDQNILNTNLIENIQDDFQNFDFDNDNTLLNDFSSSLLRPSSPTTSLTSSDSSDSDNEDEDRINFTRITPDNRKYYSVDDSILPGYTGDGGPYFPSLTAMWMFIWFTKNNIGNISNYLFKFLY
jgi:hypothetical protein